MTIPNAILSILPCSNWLMAGCRTFALLAIATCVMSPRIARNTTPFSVTTVSNASKKSHSTLAILRFLHLIARSCSVTSSNRVCLLEFSESNLSISACNMYSPL